MAKEWKPVRVRSEDERSGGSSDYISLEEGQNFVGYALFEGDPAVDEPGYYEYLEHWHNASQRRIPCAGADCPLCEDGDKPKTRAKTLWLVTKDEKKNVLDPPALRIFNFNWNIIKVFTEMRAEGDKIKGRSFRISRLDDRGNYAILPKDDKLTATDVKAHAKAKEAPDFEAIVTAQLRKAMEGLAVARAMRDDDDDDAATPVTDAKGGAKKGKEAPAPEPEDDPEGWPETAEDLQVTVSEVDEQNFILVDHDDYGTGEKVWGTKKLDLTDLAEGDTIIIDYFTDDENDKVASTFEKQEAPEPADNAEGGSTNDLPDKIEGMELEVTGECDTQNGTIPVRSEELETDFLLWVLDTMKPDWDDFTEGVKFTVTAEKDQMGDLVATEMPEVVKAKGAKAAPKGGRKTAGAGKGK